MWYPLGGTLFHFSKELGFNSGSKLLFRRFKSTRVSGFVLIRLGARVMKILVRDFTKSGPPPSTGYYSGITRGQKRVPVVYTERMQSCIESTQLVVAANAFREVLRAQMAYQSLVLEDTSCEVGRKRPVVFL